MNKDRLEFVQLSLPGLSVDNASASAAAQTLSMPLEVADDFGLPDLRQLGFDIPLVEQTREDCTATERG